MTKTYDAALVAFLAISWTLGTQSLADNTKHHTTVRRELTSSSDSDSDTVITGLRFPIVATRSIGTTNSLSSSVEEELIEALETDEQVTVVGEIQVGVLNCSTLEGAEDATTLQVAISPYEVITAERTSYNYFSGNMFADSLARKVWVGEEIVKNTVDPRRTLSLTWGEVCNVETFLLKVTTTKQDDVALSVVKTIPCLPGTTTDICVVETEVVPNEEDEPDPTEAPVERFRARGLEETRRLHSAAAKSVTGARGAQEKKRQLGSTTTIDAMFLYTDGGKEVLGDIGDTQMQTTIATALATTNEAMTNSEIDLEISPVYIGLLPYDETSTSSTTVLDTLEANEDVANMRDTYEADLVQLITDLGWTCGRANPYTGNDTDAFSTVNAICLDNLSHTHEMGHNLGCYHNRENSDAQTEYAHGYRYCNGTDPYRTILSYLGTDCIVSRYNWFSNPDVELLDKPTGTDDNDCARAIEEHMNNAWRERDIGGAFVNVICFAILEVSPRDDIRIPASGGVAGDLSMENRGTNCRQREPRMTKMVVSIQPENIPREEFVARRGFETHRSNASGLAS